jgi:hypothetical protein
MIKFAIVITLTLSAVNLLFAANNSTTDSYFILSPLTVLGISNNVPEIISRPWTTNNEQKIRDQLYWAFSEYYPSIFSPFNYEKLNEFFVDHGAPSILLEKKVVDDQVTGKEEFKYFWQTKQAWLESLKKNVEERNLQYKVKVAIIGIFNDNLDFNRYWVALKQDWKTEDSIGQVVYQDNSYLFFKADFDSSDMHINIKQQFYAPVHEYNYDDQETGMKKHEKLARDIEMYLMKDFSGIDTLLKRAMVTFVEEKIRPGK